MDFQSPQPSPQPIDYNLAIKAVTILGILATSILLLGYYIFVIKCYLTWRYDGEASRFFRWPRRRLDYSFNVESIVVKSRGLGASAIQAIPALQYRDFVVSADKGIIHKCCAVCLNEFKEDERIRVLSSCLHVFHLDCIDTWLQANDNCPICRSSVAILPPICDEESTENRSESIVIEVGDERRGN